jgi:hypothetical protein
MVYDILIGIVLVVLGCFVLFNYRKLFIEELESRKDLPKQPELITDTSGYIEVVKEEENVKELKVKKPSVKKASKKVSKRKPRREL